MNQVIPKKSENEDNFLFADYISNREKRTIQFKNHAYREDEKMNNIKVKDIK